MQPILQFYASMSSIKDDIAQEIPRRRDMREVLTFTIDPADAKDFDDALSFDILEGGLYQVGVHIADVTHYVLPDTDIDDEAYRKGTTIYEVNRVTPMLPERLCNDLCSLRPNEDKLCMSVIFTMTADAKVVKHKICRTVIRSDFRLTYEQAQALLSAEGNLSAEGGPTAQRSYLVWVALVTAGAIGNIIDCVCYGKLFGYAGWFYGKVVDMFYFPLITNRAGECIFFRPVFNFADSCITVAVIVIILFYRKELNQSLEKK